MKIDKPPEGIRFEEGDIPVEDQDRPLESLQMFLGTEHGMPCSQGISLINKGQPFLRKAGSDSLPLVSYNHDGLNRIYPVKGQVNGITEHGNTQ